MNYLYFKNDTLIRIIFITILLLLFATACSSQINQVNDNAIKPFIVLKQELNKINKIPNTTYNKYTAGTRKKIAKAIKLSNQFYSVNAARDFVKNYEKTSQAIRDAITAIAEEDPDVDLKEVKEQLDILDNSIKWIGFSQNSVSKIKEIIQLVRFLRSGS